MRRAVISSSRIATSCKPWRILQCHTWPAAAAAAIASHSHSDPKALPPAPPLPTPFMPLLPVHSHILPCTPAPAETGWAGAGVHGRTGIWRAGAGASPMHSRPAPYPASEVGNAGCLLRLARLHAVKQRLLQESAEAMAYDDLLHLCVGLGVSSSYEEAARLMECLNNATLIFILQDTVYLHPKKVAKLMCKVLPKAHFVKGEKKDVLQQIDSLKEEKKDIDKHAYKYSRKVLWLGFAYSSFQMILIFRLTFWDLSWDVMEPIAYFVTNITLLLGYAFFMITSKNPSFQNLDAILCSSKQHTLMRQRNFDLDKFCKLQQKCKPPIVF